MQLVPFNFALTPTAPEAAPTEAAPEGFMDVLAALLALPQMPVQPVAVPADLAEVTAEVPSIEGVFADIDALEAIEQEPQAPARSGGAIEGEGVELLEGQEAGGGRQELAAPEVADDPLIAPQLDAAEAPEGDAPLVRPVQPSKLEPHLSAEALAKAEARGPLGEVPEVGNRETPEIPSAISNQQSEIAGNRNHQLPITNYQLSAGGSEAAKPQAKRVERPESEVRRPESTAPTTGDQSTADTALSATTESPEAAIRHPESPEQDSVADESKIQSPKSKIEASPEFNVQGTEAPEAAERPQPRDARIQRMHDDAALARRQFELVRQVAHNMALRNVAGDIEMRIALTPPNLGTVKLKLRVEDGSVSGTMIADSAATRQLLQQHTNELRDALAKEGLQLGAFDVSSESRESREQRRNTPRHIQHTSTEEVAGERAFEVAQVRNGRVQGYL